MMEQMWKRMIGLMVVGAIGQMPLWGQNISGGEGPAVPIWMWGLVFLLVVALVLVSIKAFVLNPRQKSPLAAPIQVPNPSEDESSPPEPPFQEEIFAQKFYSLRAQMNPHLIFNSLNTIRSYILQKRNDLASDYLTKFAQLLRLNLDNLQKEEITLARELQALKYYVKLEQMRFEEPFEFEIDLGPEVDKHMTKIPPMLLQPFLENRIWNGFRGLDVKGLLLLRIKQEDSALKIIIKDNGYVPGSLRRSSNLVSDDVRGIQATIRRLQILTGKEEPVHFFFPEKEGEKVLTGFQIVLELPLENHRAFEQMNR